MELSEGTGRLQREGRWPLPSRPIFARNWNAATSDFAQRSSHLPLIPSQERAVELLSAGHLPVLHLSADRANSE